VRHGGLSEEAARTLSSSGIISADVRHGRRNDNVKLTVALAGNPNAGKSTLFNALTGLRQHTGNWPGKTVEKRSGRRTVGRATIEFVDLPGAYSLAAYSPDEVVARDYLVAERPDAVVCVVDATNLERNLYLAVQLIELGLPVILALNMSDQADAQGIQIDTARLSHLLGDVPVVATAARKGRGIDALLDAVITLAGQQPERRGRRCRCRCHCPYRQGDAFQVHYEDALEESLQRLSQVADSQQEAPDDYCPRWLSLKLLEGEPDIARRVALWPAGRSLVEAAGRERRRLSALLGEEVELVAADGRYCTVSRVARQVVSREQDEGVPLTDRIDRLVTNRILGLPIFLAVMYLVFRLVIDVSAPFLEWVDLVITGPISYGLIRLLGVLGAAAWLESLVIDGVVAGVGGILTFVPGLIVLFLFLALLEDSGYMARAAFVMDRFTRVIGLHGKSVIPLMLGFGCAVPAVYATRTIANRRDRLLTALLIPFMSCSARLPVYLVFGLAFFGSRAGLVVWLLYVLGVAIAVLVGFVLSRTILKRAGEGAFVLELPPYRMPTLKSLGLHTWENTREFIRHAGTVILAVSIVLWFLLNLPWGVVDQHDSYFGQVSRAVSPAFRPAGFEGWETSGALMSGFVAKELVVSALSQIYLAEELERPEAVDLGQVWKQTAAGFGRAAVDAGRRLLSLAPGIDLLADEPVPDDTALIRALQGRFSSLSAAAFLVFVLLYVPCMATIGAIGQEFGGRWAASAAVYQTAIAWLAAVLVFQGGRLLGLG
jgi:ferrous iron transport protein B